MMYRKRLAALAVVGLFAGLLTPGVSGAATKKVKAIAQPPGAKASAQRKTACAKKGYAKYGFTNQGQCIAYGSAAAPAATQAPATQAPAVAAPAAGGASGGSAIFGVDAETNNWLPGPGSWGGASAVVAYAVYDTLLANGPDGKPVPNLLESITPSGDYKTWTLKARSGIKFHNGEDFNAEAIAIAMEHIRTGPTTAPAWGNLIKCEATGPMVAECRMKTAWVSFPFYLTGQSGVVPAPASIKSGDGAKRPVGTGAFLCKGDCWVPNQKMSLVKNPNYWRPGLPKLDSLEIRPIPDEDQRLAQLQSGQIQFLSTANFLTGRDLANLAKDKKINLLTSENGASTAYDIPNLARTGPMQDVRVRQAWAYAIDTDTLIQLRAPGATKANGLYLSGQLGYLTSAGYQFNLDKAKALLDAYKKDKGVSTVTVTFQTTAVPDNQQTIAVMKQMLDKAGFNIILGPGLEQSAYIQAVLTGNFEVMSWNYPVGGPSDPDQGRPFIHSEGCGGPTVCPRAIGFSVLNWSRSVDGIVDTALDQIRTNSDPEVRKRAAEAVETQFSENAFLLFRWRSRSHMGFCAKCTVPAETGVAGDKLQFAPSGTFRGQAYLTVG